MLINTTKQGDVAITHCPHCSNEIVTGALLAGKTTCPSCDSVFYMGCYVIATDTPENLLGMSQAVDAFFRGLLSDNFQDKTQGGD